MEGARGERHVDGKGKVHPISVDHAELIGGRKVAAAFRNLLGQIAGTAPQLVQVAGFVGDRRRLELLVLPLLVLPLEAGRARWRVRRPVLAENLRQRQLIAIVGKGAVRPSVFAASTCAAVAVAARLRAQLVVLGVTAADLGAQNGPRGDLHVLGAGAVAGLLNARLLQLVGHSRSQIAALGRLLEGALDAAGLPGRCGDPGLHRGLDEGAAIHGHEGGHMDVRRADVVARHVG
mmetsp:Transcript_77038/g.222808  ORF Transcript_77038/g.222808 Transcript_77038/m.222808 type:complete len:234 (+) Transcript_77038:3314-4015(+)